MKPHLKERALLIAGHIINTKDTIRGTAEKLKLNRNTVYRDVIFRLPEIDENLADEVLDVLKYNKGQRHIRGGEGNKKRWDRSLLD